MADRRVASKSGAQAPYFPHVQLTAADAEIWDYWVAYRKPYWRSALMAASFASDAADLALMSQWQALPNCWAHYAPHRSHAILTRGAPLARRD